MQKTKRKTVKVKCQTAKTAAKRSSVLIECVEVAEQLFDQEQFLRFKIEINQVILNKRVGLVQSGQQNFDLAVLLFHILLNVVNARGYGCLNQI